MQIITKNEFLNKEQFYLEKITQGKIFIYPTDTIYGLGCDAQNLNSIQKIKKIKLREEKPFSIIVPNKKWIQNNCITYNNSKNYLDLLPGKYTLIFKLKKLNQTIAIRIPNNWFSKWLSKNNLTFITTSVNITGEKHITKLEDLNEKIKQNIDYFIVDGEINNSPSTIIDLTLEIPKIIRN